MSLQISRAVVRQTRQLPGRTARRFESTSTKATEAAKETAAKVSSNASEAASSFQSKASEGLSRVTSSAGPAIAGVAKGVGSALGKIGGRTGRLIAFVERQIPPTIYYSRVGLELSKLVFKGQNMTPPPVSTFQAYFQKLIQTARNPSAILQQASKTAEGSSSEGLLNRLRNINQAQLVAGGVVAAECLGFFTAGEMIGRMKLIGYRGDTGAHH